MARHLVPMSMRSLLSIGAIYFAGALLVTAKINVPMNEAQAQVKVPTDSVAASDIWQAYSTPWLFWNALRALVSGLALLMTGLATFP